MSYSLYWFTGGVLFHVEWCMEKPYLLRSYHKTSLSPPLTIILISTLKHTNIQTYIHTNIHTYITLQTEEELPEYYVRAPIAGADQSLSTSMASRMGVRNLSSQVRNHFQFSICLQRHGYISITSCYLSQF